ncbi:MAG: Ig-like domain-containing protein [Treponema sp.]|jgi:uncharacterized protein YjdB|nr:Ig-like domain-containing protein [Treponema sp.]
MKHKKIIVLIVVLITAFLSIFSCYPPGLDLDVPPPSGDVWEIHIEAAEEQGSPYLAAEDTLQLKAIVKKDGSIIEDAVTWASSNETIAKVSESGFVSAIASGETVHITATSSSGQKSAAYAVDVKRLAISSRTNTDGDPSTNIQLVATYEPGNISVEDVEWTLIPDSAGSITDGLLSLDPEVTGTVTVRAEIKDDTGEVKFVTEVPINIEESFPVIIINGNKESSKLMALGQTFKLTATDQDGNDISSTVSWSSDKTEFATVSNSGLITAESAGTAIITASITDELGQTSTNSFTANVRELDILLPPGEPTPANITRGEQVALTAVLIPGNEKVTASWETVSGAGTITPGTGILTTTSTVSGTTQVKASFVINGTTITATEVIDIIPPPASTINIDAGNSKTVEDGATIPLTASVLDSSSAEISGAAITWSSDNTSVATVSSASGTSITVSAVALGDANITASVGTLKKTFALRVRELAIVIPPDNTPEIDITRGETLELTAILTAGTEHEHVDAAWEITDGAANVNPIEITTEGAILTTNSTDSGSATVQASFTLDGTTFTADEVIAIVPPTAEIINIDQGYSQTVAKGATIPLSVKVLDENDAVIGDAEVTWLSNNESVATVSSASGTSITVSAVGLGTANITASVGTLSKTFTVHVRELIIIVPPDDTPTIADISRGEKIQLSAALTAGSETELVSAEWSFVSGNVTGDTLNASTGILETTSTVSGTFTVKASVLFDGTTFTTTKDISRVIPPASIINIEWEDINPAAGPAQGPRQLMAGESIQLNAIVQDTSASPIDGAEVTWSSNYPNIATVDPDTGIVAAVSAGDVIITATSGNKQKTYTIEVRELTLDPEGPRTLLVLLGFGKLDIDPMISDGTTEKPAILIDWGLSQGGLELISEGVLISPDGVLSIDAGLLSLSLALKSVTVTGTIPGTNITATKDVTVLGL